MLVSAKVKSGERRSVFKNQIEQVFLVRIKFPLIARGETVLELTDGLFAPLSVFELTKTRTRGSFFRTFTTSRQSTCCTNSVSVSKKYSVTRVTRKRPSLRTFVSVSSRCFEHPDPLGDTFAPFLIRLEYIWLSDGVRPDRLSRKYQPCTVTLV